MNDDQTRIDEAVRRSAGIAALRRLRRLVDAEDAQHHVNARWARRLGIVFALAALLLACWLGWRAVG